MKFLKEVYLSNWYGFVNERIYFDKYGTFITGENESGKSTILDAIKYAFMGDTQFNKGAEAKGAERRTLASYTRCLYNPSERLFHRKDDDIYTHIFLGFEDDGISAQGSPVLPVVNPITIGCIIHTNKNNNTDTTWYKIEKDIKDVIFTKNVDGHTYSLIGREFVDSNEDAQSANNIVSVFPNANLAIKEFMFTLGLRFNEYEMDKYKDEMRRMLAYNSKNKIVDFIKEYVLKPSAVNIDRLRESKKDFDNVKREMDKLLAEVQGLTAIRESFNKYQSALKRIAVDEYKTLLHYNSKSARDLKILESDLVSAKHEKESLDRRLAETRNKIVEINKEIMQINRSLEGRAEPIEEMNNRLQELQNKKMTMQKAIDRIEVMCHTLNTLAANCIISYSLLECDWTDRDIDAWDKERNLGEIRDAIQSKLDKYLDELHKATVQKNEHMDTISELNDDINGLKNNSARVPEDVRTLINAINAEFAGRRINAKATYAAESVVEIVDEDWRDAVEACVGNDRYNVLVDKEYYDIAYAVQGRLKLKNARLVNVKKLFDKTYRVLDDSVFNLLQIENKTARKYFEFRLGTVVACERPDDVDKYEKAIAQNRRASGNMTVFYMHDVKDFCMGMQSIKMTLARKEQARNKAHKELSTIESRIATINAQIQELKNVQVELNKDFDFEIYDDMYQMRIQIANQIRRINEAQDTINGDEQYVENLAQLNACQNRRAAAEQEATDLGRQIGRVESKIERTLKDIETAKALFEEQEAKLMAARENTPDEAVLAESEYAKYLEDVQSGKTVRPFLLPETLAKKKDEAYRELMTLESTHHAVFRDFECTVDEAQLRKSLQRLDEIAVKDLEVAKNKLSEQQASLEAIFKNEIVVAIYENVNEGKRRLRMMNNSLKKMSFETEYQFVTKDIVDGSDYEIIMNYARYLQAEQDAQASLFGQSNFTVMSEEETKKLLDDIQTVLSRIASDDTDVDYLQGLADYRNYMTYDIRTENKATGQAGLLSKDSGYNSGAGAQIPYTVILTVALVMEYNKNPEKSTIRIMFMDEPFEKMSSNNVKKMIDFFREQNLQVIFCGASKMDCIGENCGAIIPVLKKDRCHMTIGSVNYKQIA